jgi:hypothetical protein
MFHRRNAVLKGLRDMFLGPSVHIDDAAADAVSRAIVLGEHLSMSVRVDLEAAALIKEIDITPALNTPLSVIKGGNGNTEPSSLLAAACVGAVAAVDLRELLLNRLAGSQGDVLHGMVARSIAAWEVGQENIGRAPNPYTKKGMHMSFPPGTLTGGKKSVAGELMKSFVLTGQSTREETARYISETLIAILGLGPIPSGRPAQFSVLNRLGIDRGTLTLPGPVVDSVMERVLGIDFFWPNYLERKRVIR